MLASWVVFEVRGTIAGLIVGVILLDFGEQGALVSNQHVIYALRPEARNRLNTIFMGGMFVGGAVGSAGASLAWEFDGWDAACTFGAALVAIALASMLGVVWPRSRRAEHHAPQTQVGQQYAAGQFVATPARGRSGGAGAPRDGAALPRPTPGSGCRPRRAAGARAARLGARAALTSGPARADRRPAGDHRAPR